MSNQYSPEVEAFLDERAKETSSFNGPRLNPSKIRLIGKDPNKPNTEKMGRFFIKNWSEQEKKYLEEIPFGSEPNQSFTGVILETLYYAKWKYKEGSKVNIRTREIKDWKTEPVELLKMTYSDGGVQTHTQAVFPNYGAFRDKFVGRDELTGEERAAPYDLWAAIYVWHAATNSIVKYEVKGATRSAYFDYDKQWKKALPDAKALLQVLTTFGVNRDEKGNFIGTFFPGGIMDAEGMKKVMEHWTVLQEWRKAWKTVKTPPMDSTASDELPVIQVDEQAPETPVEPEIDVSNIPF